MKSSGAPVSPTRISSTKVFLLIGFCVILAGCPEDDGGGGGVIRSVNASPTANAGPDQIANERATVSLPGSGIDRDGRVESYRWTQISGSSVDLDDSESAATQFVAPDFVEGESNLVFRLTVTDDRGATASDEVTVIVNAPLTANAGPDQTAEARATVSLPGSGVDRDGRVESYRWTQISGSSVDLDDSESAATQFVAPDFVEGESNLVFRLTVTDDRGATASDEVTVIVNAPPTANAGPDQTAEARATVSLPGSGVDRDGRVESYRWTQISGSSVDLDDSESAATQFVAPDFVEGESNLVFRLTVTDDRGATASDEVTVIVSPPPPPSQKDDPFARWNDLDPQPWWRESEPYSCVQEEKQTSLWLDAGLVDLGGADPLSLIRYFGNGSYLRYGQMGFYGCTRLDKYPDAFHLDPPVDPTYYSLGDLDIWVDVARVPPDAAGWFLDDGTRVTLSMAEAVALLNTYVAPYFRRISDDQLRIIFHPSNEFDVVGDGSPAAAEDQQFRLAGACLDGCKHGSPGGLNRILLNDVAVATGGSGYNGWAHFGLASFSDENMEVLVHEVGHAWMAWPHSFTEVPWRSELGREIEPPNPYSNFYDVMSGLSLVPILGWSHSMPWTLAINRYAAGWIRPVDVALHLHDDAAYTLRKPGEIGYQLLVIHSGRRYAFSTLEVLQSRPARYRINSREVYDRAAPGARRSRRYDGVLVSRYDQTAGTGSQARFGPALYDKDNPQFLTDVGWGRDDYSVIPDGGARDIGGGVSVSVLKNSDGSYNVTVSGGNVAEFETWCPANWFSRGEYDTGCFLDEAVWE